MVDYKCFSALMLLSLETVFLGKSLECLGCFRARIQKVFTLSSLLWDKRGSLVISLAAKLLT